MRQIVVNADVGGFGLSAEAEEWLRCRTPQGWPRAGRQPTDDRDTHAFQNSRSIPRDDPYLVACVQALGAKANGEHAVLRIVEIPDDVEWQIVEGGEGQEWVAEKHRTWEPE